MALSEKGRELSKKIALLMREKNFSSEAQEFILMMSHAKDMTAKTGTSEKAKEIILDCVKNANSEQEVIDKILFIMGLEK